MHLIWNEYDLDQHLLILMIWERTRCMRRKKGGTQNCEWWWYGCDKLFRRLMLFKPWTWLPRSVTAGTPSSCYSGQAYIRHEPNASRDHAHHSLSSCLTKLVELSSFLSRYTCVITYDALPIYPIIVSCTTSHNHYFKQQWSSEASNQRRKMWTSYLTS